MPEKARILIVEDDYLIATMLEDIIATAGWDVVGPVGHLAEAIEAATHQECEAAVLDINLDGEMAYPIAEVLSRRKVPFVFLSGYGPSGEKGPFGDRPCISKPFRPRELLDMLRDLLTPRAAEA